MARKVFFSFDYKDVASFRANVIRNSSRFRGKNEGYIIDSSIWESAQTKGTAKIKEIIDQGLHGSSVSAVIIGSNTAERRWVKYEIFQSFARGNGLLGIYVNKIPDKFGFTCAKGNNPFDRLGIRVSLDGRTLECFELVDGKWKLFPDLPVIRNSRSNTKYMGSGGWFSEGTFGKFFKLSCFFSTYCWDYDQGYQNIANWVEKAYDEAKTEYTY